MIDNNEFNKFIQGFETLDFDAQLIDYSQYILELTYKMKTITIHRVPTDPNIDSWIQVGDKKFWYWMRVSDVLHTFSI
jgi:hypothetical protein